jgi:signal transduction histidine kinase
VLSVFPPSVSESPRLLAGSAKALHLESVLQDLPLYDFCLSADCSGADLIELFDQHPLLPGVLLVEQGSVMGMISRRRLLEGLIQPRGMELVLQAPLRVVHRYRRCDVLRLAADTPILVAAQQALRRSPELLGEPVVVYLPSDVVPPSSDPDQPATPILAGHYLLDSHDLNIAHWQIRGIETQVRYERIQTEMIQSDKMANLGRLVDGVAHEILDPVSFIWGNLSHVSNYTQELLNLLAAYEAHLPNLPKSLAALQEEIELDYLRQDLPRAIASIKTGSERLSKLASSLQNFCHIDEVYPKPMDLHECLDSILLLLKGRLSSEICVVRHYGNLPPVSCFPGQLNQVFMNILSGCVNALLDDAIGQQIPTEFRLRHPLATQATPPPPQIEITTQICSIPALAGTAPRWVSIRIADNGPGLSAEAEKTLLDAFSLERRAEKETSLSVSYHIVTAKHGGKFKVRSRGKLLSLDSAMATCSEPTTLLGTEFEILLPLG